MKFTESFLKENTPGSKSAICPTYLQAQILGISYPLPQGWIYRVLDTEYSEQEKTAFIEAKNVRRKQNAR